MESERDLGAVPEGGNSSGQSGTELSNADLDPDRGSGPSMPDEMAIQDASVPVVVAFAVADLHPHVATDLARPRSWLG